MLNVSTVFLSLKGLDEIGSFKHNEDIYMNDVVYLGRN